MGDAGVQVSGFQVGKVTSIELDGPRVLIKFTVDKNIRLGDRTEAAIKTKGLLGTKILEITPRGEGQQDGTIPLDRTTSPYQLPDALGELATTISGLNTNQLSDSLAGAVGDIRRHPAGTEDRGRRCGPVLGDAQRARRAAAWPADQRQQDDRGACRAQQPDRRPGRQHQRTAGRASKPKCRTGSDLGQHLRAQSAAAGFHRREPRDDETRTGQAQRGAHDPRQPQGTPAEVAQTAHPVLDVAWRIGGIRALLQDLCREPAAGTVPAAVHRRRVLRPRPGSQRAAAFGTQRPTGRPAGDTGTAGALPADRPRRRTASDSARRHHRQSGRSGLRSARLAAARPYRLLPVPRAAARTAARRTAARTSRGGATRVGLHAAADAESRHAARTG